jgi:hypothetical protein
MELAITQQLIKGGSEVLMVRLGKRPILSFPLNMPDLAAAMVKEAQQIDERDADDLIALVNKFSDMKTWHEQNDTSAAPVEEVQPEPVTTIVIAPKHELGGVQDALGELLECARRAELRLATAHEKSQQAYAVFQEAEREANAAWSAFNEALHKSLPPNPRIAGIRIIE